MSDTRGQAFTLEGVIGAMILLTAVLFALNSAVLLPSTGETGNQAQIEQEAKDVMQIAADEELLSETVRCYDEDQGGWFSDPGTTNPPPNDLGTMLEDTFADRDRSYNLEVVPADDEQIVYQGAATRDGVTVSRTVTLYNDDQRLSGADCSEAEEPLENTDEYPIDPDDNTEEIYNVVEVRLTIR